MKRADLKKIIKPLVKECILESLIEEGILSSIISEVVQGTQPLVENRPYLSENNTHQQEMQEKKALEQKRRRLEEHRQKMIEAVNADAYGGVNLFEGTTPTPTPSGPADPLRGIDPLDSGVDISGIMTNTWKKLAQE